jgi:hypothetical protein
LIQRGAGLRQQILLSFSTDITPSIEMTRELDMILSPFQSFMVTPFNRYPLHHEDGPAPSPKMLSSVAGRTNTIVPTFQTPSGVENNDNAGRGRVTDEEDRNSSENNEADTLREGDENQGTPSGVLVESAPPAVDGNKHRESGRNDPNPIPSTPKPQPTGDLYFDCQFGISQKDPEQREMPEIASLQIKGSVLTEVNAV